MLVYMCIPTIQSKTSVSHLHQCAQGIFESVWENSLILAFTLLFFPIYHFTSTSPLPNPIGITFESSSVWLDWDVYMKTFKSSWAIYQIRMDYLLACKHTDCVLCLTSMSVLFKSESYRFVHRFFTITIISLNNKYKRCKLWSMFCSFD